ncbi:XRE family transcriptional regulator [Clostridium novyi A str. 4552]|uniref:Sugar fermentation stimulation protein homolog n=1 Tax=Clostridium novyi A str. 4552 TaxID=1444289 RepID=A0A0A0I0W8_CLONO|nr:DNA/RNA nuclease SfsA [Clostridium novyi]KGM94001.1 XRE family transcriptional regulator [Clostridium novyi A str. 4552]
MKINNVLTAKFIKRPNRFVAYVYLNNEEIKVHVPNTGRCREILVPDTKVVLREGTNPNRKTKYDLIAAYKRDKLINIDSQIPNAVVEEALKNKKIQPLVKFNNIKREQTFGNSRFDFKLWDDKNNEYYLEVKGVTLEDNGKCMFPDAPTERGTKHILELIEIKESNMGAGILFLIQLSGAKIFSPHKEMDKKFSDALVLAQKKGVDIFCYDCSVGEDYIEIKDPVDIIL